MMFFGANGISRMAVIEQQLVLAISSMKWAYQNKENLL